MLKVGVIGTGNISHCHMEGYTDLERRGLVELTACCDIDEAKLQRYVDRYHFKRSYTDFNEMMEKEDLDMVSVTTWNAVHKDATIAALNGGANVICEKPMAMNAAEAQEMWDCAKKNNKILQIGFVRRFENGTQTVLDFINDGILGDIYYSKVSYLRRDGCPGGWFGDKRYSGGGPLIDLGVHVIDLARYFAGSPKPVSAYGQTFSNMGCDRAKGHGVAWDKPESDGKFEFSVEDMATALVKFDNGFTLSIETSFNLNIPGDTGEMKVFGTKGGVDYYGKINIYTDMAGRYVNVTTAESGDQSFGDMFKLEIFNFANAVQGKEPPRATGEDGIIVMKILDAIYESARTGKSVDIKC